MNLRVAFFVLLASVIATSAWAQPRTAPAVEGEPRPAMIVGGHTLAPAVWAEDLEGKTVTVNGISMMYVGKAAREAGRTIMFSDEPEGRILSIRVGLRSIDFLILPPGEFWRHPWVRHLIARADIYRLQPLPYWPYQEANIPARPPHNIDPRWPFLVWKPDEAWLLLNLEPPPAPEPELVMPTDIRPRVTPEEPDVEVAPPPAPPPDEMAPPPGMDAPPPMDDY